MVFNGRAGFLKAWFKPFIKTFVLLLLTLSMTDILKSTKNSSVVYASRLFYEKLYKNYSKDFRI